jgi:tetratricopeptide (TPR) repeat protein
VTPARRWGPPILVAALTFACFAPALRNGFVNWDDDVNFTDNTAYRGLAPPNLRWMFTDTFGHYMPLTWLTLGLDYELWGLDPTGYHLTSLLFHAANAALVFFILTALLGGEGAAPPAAAIAGALLFSIHPLRVESVAWATERRDVVSGFFFLLSILAYLRMARSETPRRWLALSAAAFAGSLLSKATGLTLPLVLLVLDVYPLGRAGLGARRLMLEKLPFFVLTIGSAVMTFVTQSQAGALAAAQSYGWIDRLVQPGYRSLFYIGKTLVPIDLSPLYLVEYVTSPPQLKFVLAWLGAAAVTGLLVALRRRVPALLSAWIAYAALIAPFAGLFQFGLHFAADRNSYLACLPWAALAAAGLRALGGRRPAVALVLGAAAIGAAGATSVRQIRVWSDSIALWNHAIEADPSNYVAYLKRGTALGNEGREEEALADFVRSIQIRPDYAFGYANLGVYHLRRGDRASARRALDRALELDPALIDARLNRATVRLRSEDGNGALADLDEAIRREPRHGPARVMRAELRRARGDPAGAREDLEVAIRARPMDPSAYRVRGLLAFERGDLRAGIQEMTLALDRDPRDFDALVFRGMARLQLNDRAGGEADLQAASAIHAGEATPYLVRAMGLYIRGDRARAALDLETAMRLSAPGSPVRTRAQELMDRCRPAPP